MAIEQTLALIKPDAVRKQYIGQIIQRYEESGFQIRGLKMVRLSQSDAESLYAVHRERPFFKSLISFMTSGPIVALRLEGEQVVERHRVLMGATDPSSAEPGTLRQAYGASIDENAVHGSDSPATAAVEIPFFF